MTPYKRHQALDGHDTTREAVNTSPYGADILETCSDCGQQWLHTDRQPYTITIKGDYTK